MHQYEVGLGPGHIVFDEGTQLPKGAHQSQYSARVYCDQTAGWIKMPLGTEVGLGPDVIVLDRDPAPPSTEMGTASPLFGPCKLWPNIWMDQDTAW